MIKTCQNCQIPFNTRDSRQKSCSKSCADVMRSVTQLQADEECVTATYIPSCSITPILPDPETLPAAYVKRVHDLWVSLTEDGPTRIA